MKPFHLIIIMGVSGSGKTTVAQQLADEIGASFLDADDFHSESARQQMAAGVPLTDEQRLPWIGRIIEFIEQNLTEDKCFVLAYSGLRKAHRKLFLALPYSVKCIMLQTSKQVIAARLQRRSEHFFDANLLHSQFESLELPNDDEQIMLMDANQPLASLKDSLTARLGFN